MQKHLLATEWSNRHIWENGNFLCEEKYLEQCTAASLGEELEKENWQFKRNWSYICTSHQKHFYYSFLFCLFRQRQAGCKPIANKSKKANVQERRNTCLIKTTFLSSSQEQGKKASCSFTGITYENTPTTSLCVCAITDSEDQRCPSLMSAVLQNMTCLSEPYHDEPNLPDPQTPTAMLWQMNFCSFEMMAPSISYGLVVSVLKKRLPFEVCLINPFWFFRKFCQKNLFFFFQSAFPKRKVGRKDKGKGKRISERNIS